MIGRKGAKTVLDVNTMIGLLSSFVTIEEAARGWFGIARRRFKKKEFDLNTYRTEDPLLQAQLDAFKSALLETGRPEIFSREQIELYKGEFYKDIGCRYLERKELGKVIDDIFADLNQYIRSQMSVGETVLWKQGERTQQMIREVEQKVADHPSKDVEVCRLLTAAPPKVPAAYAYREQMMEELVDLAGRYEDLAIWGIGGIGKTTVARDLFCRMEESDDYLAWLEYSGNLKKDIIFAGVADAIQKGQEEMEAFLLRHRGHVLFFVDNADERLFQDPYFRELDGTVRFIVTTRRNDIPDMFYSYEVPALSEDHACELFWRYYGARDAKAEVVVRKFLRKMQCHTLMIEMAAKTARWAECPLEEYLHSVLEQGYETSADTIATSHDTEEDTIARHLIHLYHMQKLSETETYILKNFAVAPEEVLPYVFRRWIAGEHAQEDALKPEFRNLCKRGWIAKVSTGYEMHPVVREAILLQDKPAFEDVHALIWHILDDEEAFFDESLDYETVCGRIRLVDSLVRHFPPKEQEAMQTVMTVLVVACKNYCMFDKAISYADLDLELNLENYGVCHPYTEESLYNKALVLEAMQQYREAIVWCEILLKVTKVLWKDENHKHYFLAYRLYGTLLAKSRRYREAIETFDRALKIENEVITEQDRLVIEFNKISVWMETQQYQLAERLLAEREADFYRVFGGDHIYTATLYQNKANLYANKYDFEHALEYDRKALDIRRKKLKDDHVDTAQSYYAVAEDRSILGVDVGEDLDEVIDYAQKAYRTWEKLLGEDDKYTRMALRLLRKLQNPE